MTRVGVGCGLWAVDMAAVIVGGKKLKRKDGANGQGLGFLQFLYRPNFDKWPDLMIDLFCSCV